MAIQPQPSSIPSQLFMEQQNSATQFHLEIDWILTKFWNLSVMRYVFQAGSKPYAEVHELSLNIRALLPASGNRLPFHLAGSVRVSERFSPSYYTQQTRFVWPSTSPRSLLAVSALVPKSFRSRPPPPSRQRWCPSSPADSPFI